MSYYDAKQPIQPDQIQPQMSGPSGPVPIKPGEYTGTPPPVGSPAPPTYSQHFTGGSQTGIQPAGSPPPQQPQPENSYVGSPGAQDTKREFYGQGQPQGQQTQYAQQPQYGQQQPQYPQQPQQSYNSGNQGVPPMEAITSPGGNVYHTATPLYALGSSPAPAQCPSCGARTMTRTQFHTGNTTHAWAIGLFLTTCLCCIPYFVTGTKDCEHRCGNCGILLATWHRSGRTEVQAHG